MSVFFPDDWVDVMGYLVIVAGIGFVFVLVAEFGGFWFYPPRLGWLLTGAALHNAYFYTLDFHHERKRRAARGG